MSEPSASQTVWIVALSIEERFIGERWWSVFLI